MHKFKAYRTFEEDKAIVSRFVEMAEEELDPGDVLVKTKYSTINYKDALSHNGTGKIMRKYPTNAGIDMAGTVERSGDTRWKRGDKVIVHAYDMGVAHDGGYAEYVRVPGDWIVRRPESMTAFDAMTLGTAGFTAAQAIMAMEHNGLKPGNGPVAVTGAVAWADGVRMASSRQGAGRTRGKKKTGPCGPMYALTVPASRPSAARSASRKVCGYRPPAKAMPACWRTVLCPPSHPTT